jgi:hypothetical protein
VRSDPGLDHLRIVSGPLQGLQGPNKGNGAAGYLERMYQQGIGLFGWGRGRPFPFDGVGYHLYIHEEVHEDRARQANELNATYAAYMEQMRGIVRQHEGSEKPFYISEIGWFSNSDNRERGEAFQAMSMAHGLGLPLRDPSVALVIHFCTQDFGQLHDGKWYGLYRQGAIADETRKPAHAALCAISTQPELVPTPVPLGPLDDAAYVEGKDAVADESIFAAGQPFQQVWFLRNTGTSAWAAGYTLAHIGGDRLGAPERVPLPTCDPGAEVPVPVPFVAPAVAGRYLSLWQPCNPAGQPFGQRIWTIINVAAAVPAGVPVPAAPALVPAEGVALQASLRFLVRLGVIYESALERLPAAGDAEEVNRAVAEAVVKARKQLEELLGVDR